MKKIGFFGGCFNPPNNLHIKIADDLIKEKKLDEVIFVPVNDYYEKNALISAIDRYNMLKLAIKGHRNLKVDDVELKEERELFAVDIFNVINKKYNNNDIKLYMVMGSDNFKKMPNWKDYESIKDKYNYIVINRHKNSISSTKIRNMIKNNDNRVKEFLPQQVYKYIIDNNLYK